MKSRNPKTYGVQAIQYQAHVVDYKQCSLKRRCLRDENQKSPRRFTWFQTHLPEHQTHTKRMKQKIDSIEGKYEYSKRLGIIEPVFANITSTLGLDRFSLRGKVKVTAPVKIKAGRFSTCAVLGNGAAKCWDYNEIGSLGNGNGDNYNKSYAVPVYGVTTAAQIANNHARGCAVLSDGSIKCWGSGLFWGALGDGNENNSPEPVLVVGISSGVQVTAGSSHTCALLSDNSVQCWGNNESNQLGDEHDAYRCVLWS